MKIVEKNEIPYNIGLDIGTNSVGYAVTDASLGEILEFKKKRMLGSRLFEDGIPAAGRRKKRSARRRYKRRTERIKLLQMLIGKEILKTDSDFFKRLKEGYLFLEDKSVDAKYILFNDVNYSDKDYYKEYKTIYHLRAKLCNAEEKKDLRLVYLALHNLIKYRGHFLYQGQKFGEISNNIENVLEEIYLDLREKCEIDCQFNREKCNIAVETLKDTKTSKKQKEEKLNNDLKGTMDKKVLAQVIKCFLGYAADYTMIFQQEDLLDEKGTKLKISFSDSKYEEVEDNILEALQEKDNILENLKKIYSWFVLQGVLEGKTTVAEAMVERYKKHGEDVRKLKDAMHMYAEANYHNFFQEEVGKDGKKLVNYVNYKNRNAKCTKEELYKTIRKIFGKLEEKEIKEIYAEMEKGTFLPLLVTKDNAAIPYQLTMLEVEKIIDKQGRYYKELRENKDKILSIIEFRIPYYVGPMNTSSEFSWIERKSQEKIYPWNFKDIVDIDTTAEKFIERMRNKCTYLPQEETIPKYSLLYSEFVLLNELNKIKINGKKISVEDKQVMIRNLFQKKKTIKEKAFIQYLQKINYQNRKDYFIEGYQKEKEFSSNLSSYIDMVHIFGEINFSNIKMIEDIIYWLTVFEEKSIVKRKIKLSYGDKVSEKQLEKICRLRYKGWSRLSKKLLDGIKAETKDGSKQTIIGIMRKTNLNFMQVINDKKYNFAKIIKEESGIGAKDKIELPDVMELQGSPAIKRAIWQTIKIVEEIVRIMGHEPKQIFIEFAKEEGDKKRTSSRENQLKKCYKKLKEDTVEYNKKVEQHLKDKKYNQKLDNEKLLLYFLQNGKCMYTETPLDIDSLYLYQVDHILPQAYIKDDSIENKALVLGGENQYKSDKMLLSKDIRKKRYIYWTNLYKCGLIGVKKYNNLLRETVGENETKGFIQRQLVETRQIIKHVANLFSETYQNTQVVALRADLSHSFREKYQFYKSREINDFHHAHDAYLAAVIGNYLIKRFPNFENELIYNKFQKYFTKASKQSLLKAKYGYIMTLFDKEYINEEDGEILWEGKKSLLRIKDVLYSGNCQVTKKLEEQTGAFYKENICGAKTKEGMGGIPIKKELPVEKYGGYTGKISAYYMVVMYQKGKKTVKELLGIPIYIRELEKTQKGAIQTYIISQIGVSEYKVLKEKILKYQKIIENGNELYLTASAEVVNAKQFYFGQYYQECYETILKCLSNHIKDEEKKDYEKKLDEVYAYLIKKGINQYQEFGSCFEKIKDEIDFTDFSYEEKIDCIKEMLKLVQANSQNANMKKFSDKLIDRMGRKSKYKVNIEKTIFVDQSITGLYERRYHL